MANRINGPLAGIKILDIGSALSTPMAATILGDQGAEVIRVEPTGIGDFTRYVGAKRNGVSAIFQAANRGKRNIALDLKSDAGVEVFYRLAKNTDVVIHNFRPGVAERLHIDYSTLSKTNPDIIYLAVSGFGDKGPMADKPAYDNVVQAFAGVAYSQTHSVNSEPIQYQQLFADKLTAVHASQAISAALLARERGQGGQLIRLSMTDVVASFMWPDVSETAMFKDEAEAGVSVSKTRPMIRFSNGYAQIAPLSDKHFHSWCAVFGVDSSDPKLTTIVDRSANRDVYSAVTQKITERAAELDVDETIAKLEAADVPCAKAQHLSELPFHPQMQANGLFVETSHPKAGQMIEAKSPIQFSKTPSGCGSPSAELGADTDEIMQEMGYNEREIIQLRSENVIQ